MKWRCTYCGKPHESNDPPCDNCGNNEFEKAVVPLAPEAEDEDAYTTHVWVCTECGNDHPKNTPPCDRCGSGPLERREQTFDEDEVVAEMLGEGEDTDFSADVSYLDVLDFKHVLGFTGVTVLLLVVGLGFLGVVDVPGITPEGPVPGNATAADGISLSSVETAFVADLNEARSAADTPELTTDDALGSAATYLNQERVRAVYGDGDGPSRRELGGRLGDACEGGEFRAVRYAVETNLGTDERAEYGSVSALTAALREHPDALGSSVSAENGLVGVDVHLAPDGRVFVAQTYC